MTSPESLIPPNVGTERLIAAGATIPKPDHPLEATEDVLEVIRQHAA
ncbi:MAG: hypothetical protein H0X25_17150 [Acidobacteriales bacterium]|nr:hypothetical protein [Terriglobales bacterium]